MKKILKITGILFLITALVCSLIPVSDVEAQTSASDFQITGDKLVKYVGTSEIVSIPYGVKTIGNEAFANNGNLVKVTLNEDCEKIEYGAFRNCVGLRTLVMNDKVEEIESAAFSNDPYLTNLNIGAGVRKIGTAVFAGDTSLTKLTVSKSNSHYTLKNDILYDDEISQIICMLPSYQDYEYEMPLSVKKIDAYAFWGNTSLRNVTLSSNIHDIPQYAFSNCINLRMVTIPLTVKNIETKAFENCVNLSSVKCPDSLTYISDTAFDGCYKVTLSARKGSYADNFNNNIKRSDIEIAEYEDTGISEVVSKEDAVQRIINAQNQAGNESEKTFVYYDENGKKVTIDEEAMKAFIKEYEESEDESGAKENSDTPAKYAGGVINGADVKGYNYASTANEPSGNILGYSTIVGGKAMVFIDNSKVIETNNSPKEENDNTLDKNEINNDNSRRTVENSVSDSKEAYLGDLIADESGKGMNFPKFTVSNNTIASKAYYMDDSITDYVVPDNIKKIGNFAFSRSSIKSIVLPEGIEEIGYGAFYHCTNLSDIKLPSSVNKVSEYAFEDTALINDCKDSFLIIGDGILISYKGNDTVVTIPEGVKIIADGVFKGNNNIKAVNLSDSLISIGEDAFRDCKNLTTLNRGENVEKIGSNAFKNTSLSNVTIYDKVKEIGTAAFDLSNGTDTVVFKGDKLPILTEGYYAKKLLNSDDRVYAFGGMKKAIVNDSVTNLIGTVLEPGIYGFKGLVVNKSQNTISDNSQGVSSIKENNKIIINSNSSFINSNDVNANIEGSDDSFYLNINDSQNANDKITMAFSELYGGSRPSKLWGFDLSLMDSSNTLYISDLGLLKLEIKMPLPDGIKPDGLNVVTLDEDGQLEKVDYKLSEDKKILTFYCEHFSPYALYNYVGGQTVKEGEHIKDDTPDTGDFSLSPKWFLVLGFVSLGILLILLSRKKTEI